MTADEFLAWAMEQPGGRYELVDGEIVAMAPERAGHARAKARVFRRLDEAVEANRLDCEVFSDGMAVVVDRWTTYEPDAQLRCGASLPSGDTKVTDPLVVVEVLSPSTQAVDTSTKFEGYFRLASLRHYLVVAYATRTVIHHERRKDGTILTHLVPNGGPIRLDPPGITLADYFPPLTDGPGTA